MKNWDNLVEIEVLVGNLKPENYNCNHNHTFNSFLSQLDDKKDKTNSGWGHFIKKKTVDQRFSTGVQMDPGGL